MGGFKVRIEKQSAPGLKPFLVHAPELDRVFSYIIDNALDSMLEKAAHTTDFKPVLTLETKIKQDQLLISIMDNGTGIPTKLQNKAFEAFYTTKTEPHCLGLGLTMVKEIVETLLKGTVEIDSGTEWGTSIDLTISLKGG